MRLDSDSRLVRGLRAFSGISSLFSLGVGISALLGWAFAIGALRSWIPGTQPVFFTTAICFTLLGLALWILRQEGEPAARLLRLVAKIACWVVLLAGLVSLAEYLFGRSSGLEALLVHLNPRAEADATDPGLMSLVASLNVTLLAFSLLILDWRTRRRDWPAQIPAALAGIAAVFALLAFNAAGYFPGVGIAVPSAVNCLVLAAGVICARPQWVMAGILTRSSTGARWMRRVLPVTLLVLLLLGWVLAKPVLTMEHLSRIEASGIGFGACVLVVGLIVWGAILLERSERQRDLARAALKLNPEQLDLLLDHYEKPPADTSTPAWAQAGIAVGILFTCLGFYGCWRTMHQSAQDDDWIAHTEQVTNAIGTTLGDVVDVETCMRAFAATGDVQFLEPSHKGERRIPGDLDTLSSLTADDPRQQTLTGLLRTQIAARLQTADKTIAERESTGRMPPTELLLDGKRRMDAVRATVATMQDEEASLLQKRRMNAEAERRRFDAIILLSAVAGVTMLLLAGAVTMREIDRGAKMRRQIQAINATLEQRVEQRTVDLRSIEERLRLFINHAPAALAMFDREMRYLHASRRWLEDYDLPDQDLHGRLHYELFPNMPERWKEAHRRALTGELVREEDDRIERPDGSIQRLKWEVRPWHDAAGEVGGIVIFSEDTTALEKTKEALRKHRVRLDAALASMADSVCITDSEGRFVLFNEGFRSYYRFKTGDECFASFSDVVAALELFVGDDPVPVPPEAWVIQRALRGETVTDAEYTLRRKATGETWVGSYRAAPLRDEQGAINGTVIVAHDITQKKAIELEIQRLNTELELRVEQRTAQLQEAVKELEDFNYSVSHDLRAPLRHISGFSKMLMEDFAAELPEGARHYLDRIQDSARRMGLLIDDLLNLGRVGRQGLRLEVTGLRSIVEEVIAEQELECEKRAVNWKVGPLPFLDCDASLIKQVIQNLLSNSLKFTRTRSLTVIEVGQQVNNGVTTIYVRDNGVGFSMKYADKLFGVFQRLHRQEDFEGTGVGLATVQRIIQKHGGRIWAEAELDKGCTFYFTLAAAEEEPLPAGLEVAGERV